MFCFSRDLSCFPCSVIINKLLQVSLSWFLYDIHFQHCWTNTNQPKSKIGVYTKTMLSFIKKNLPKFFQINYYFVYFSNNKWQKFHAPTPTFGIIWFCVVVYLIDLRHNTGKAGDLLRITRFVEEVEGSYDIIDIKRIRDSLSVWGAGEEGFDKSATRGCHPSSLEQGKLLTEL